MSDIALVVKNGCFDLDILKGDLLRDEGLETAVAISLFTDKRVNDEELPDLEKSKRGWWGDMFPEIDQDKIGSRLWTLERAKRTQETLRLAEDYAREALQWLIDDGVVSSVSVVASFGSDVLSGAWQLDISIVRPAGNDSRFSVVWNQQEIRRG